MKTFDPSGPYTLEWAIECVRNGYPWDLLWMIDGKMGAEVAAVLRDLLKHPEKLVRTHRAMFLPNEARAIRERYKRLRKANPKMKAPIIQTQLEKALAISHGVLLDVLRRRNTYAEKSGRSSQRTPTHKRKK